jgi:phosphatidylserine decarboxylase
LPRKDHVGEPEAIIDELRAVLAEDQLLTDRLERSLRAAGEQARADLDPTLYAALEWPDDLVEYEAYVRRFIRWIPQQSGDEAWREQAPEERYARR